MASRREVVYETLKVVGFAGLVGVSIVAPNASQGLSLLLRKSRRKPKNYSALLSDLKKRGYVHVVNKQNSYTYTLTPAGAHRLQQLRIDEIEIPKPKKWDRKWRLISFDIPVTRSSKRAMFTKQLQLRNFMQLQRSLWVYPFPCFEQIEQIASHYNLLRYCSFMEVEKLDELATKRLLYHFNNLLK